MSDWRPEEWKNPNKTFAENLKGASPLDILHSVRIAEAFEAGADAMLKAISEEIEKVELAKYKKSWTSDGEKFTDCLMPVTPEDTRQTILALLRKQ